MKIYNSSLTDIQRKHLCITKYTTDFKYVTLHSNLNIKIPIKVLKYHVIPEVNKLYKSKTQRDMK